MAIGALTEEVALELEEAAAATRRIDPKGVGIFLGGLGVGVAIGFYFGYRWNREKLRAEAFKESEAEIDKIREVYQQKMVAAQTKPSVEAVIEEKGYTAVVEEKERPLKPPVPVDEEVVVVYEGGKSKDQGWNYPYELSQRDPEHPYVIHQDEFKSEESGYSQVTFTYWAGDDVITGEDNIPVPHADIVVGQNNLRWGHGADDIDVVFVRNDRLELDIEICRSPDSYEEEVLGLNSNEPE